MFCPKCGKINPDTEELCSGCSAKLREEQTVPPEKSRKGLKTAVVVAVVLIAVLVAVLVLNGYVHAAAPCDKL